LSYEINVRRAAELDIAEAQVWYESQRSGLGGEFRSGIFKFNGLPRLLLSIRRRMRMFVGQS
jgi:hypothetical protein